MVEVSNKLGNGIKLTALIIYLLVFYGNALPPIRIFGESFFALAFLVLVIPAIIGFGLSYLFIPNHDDSINKVINKIGISIVGLTVLGNFIRSLLR